METVLIIDDEASQRTLMETVLRRAGFRTIQSSDGENGVSLAENERPDLIITDINMPGTDGFDVVRRLQSHSATASIPIILMTGIPEQNGLRRSMEQGADDYLTKPFDNVTLINAVQTRLARKKAAEQSLRQVQSRLLEIISATPNFIAIAESPAGRITHLNPSARQLLELESHEATDSIQLSGCFAFCGLNPFADNVWNSVLANGGWTGEAQLLSRTGRRIPVELQILAHKDDSESWISVLARDLTESIQLRDAQKMEAIGRLAAGIAHEINTPTQYISDNLRFVQDGFKSVREVFENYAELLRAVEENRVTPELIAKNQEARKTSDVGYLLEQVPAALAESMEGTLRISRIVRAMKEFSHPGGVEKAPADLNRAIESTVAVARNEWKYVADLDLNLDSQLPSVMCLIGEINQAVLNLIVNAAHAIGDALKTRPGHGKGRITISTRKMGSEVEIRVADTGSGIPENIQSRIFEPFFTTKEVGRGTGQGLAMVYTTIVRRHDGSVRFETEPGKGTTFVLRLPIVAPAKSPTDESPLMHEEKNQSAR